MTVVYALQRALVVLQRQSRERFGGSNRITMSLSLPTLDLQKFIFLLSADQIISVPLTNTVITEVCIPYLGYAPCNSRGMYFIPQSYREHTLGMEYILPFLQ